jgi:hypothetical protein
MFNFKNIFLYNILFVKDFFNNNDSSETKTLMKKTKTKRL